jgi:hypothetical protein
VGTVIAMIVGIIIGLGLAVIGLATLAEWEENNEKRKGRR